MKVMVMVMGKKKDTVCISVYLDRDVFAVLDSIAFDLRTSTNGLVAQLVKVEVQNFLVNHPEFDPAGADKK